MLYVLLQKKTWQTHGKWWTNDSMNMLNEQYNTQNINYQSHLKGRGKFLEIATDYYQALAKWHSLSLKTDQNYYSSWHTFQLEHLNTFMNALLINLKKQIFSIHGISNRWWQSRHHHTSQRSTSHQLILYKQKAFTCDIWKNIQQIVGHFLWHSWKHSKLGKKMTKYYLTVLLIVQGGHERKPLFGILKNCNLFAQRWDWTTKIKPKCHKITQWLAESSERMVPAVKSGTLRNQLIIEQLWQQPRMCRRAGVQFLDNQCRPTSITNCRAASISNTHSNSTHSTKTIKKFSLKHHHQRGEARSWECHWHGQQDDGGLVSAERRQFCCSELVQIGARRYAINRLPEERSSNLQLHHHRFG